MKKKLDIAGMASELRGGSAFFPSYRKETPQPPPTPTEQLAPSREVGKEGSRTVGKEESREIGKEVSRESENRPAVNKGLFDINEKPYRKDSFLFTDEEFEALEDLKLDLRRRFDIKATKNDIARSAMQQLFSDFHQNAGESFIVKNLKKKGRH